MPTKQFVVGADSLSPVNGQTTFVSDFLGECLVNFLIVNNVNENQLNPNPDFTHSYIERKLSRSNPWITGDKLIVDYTPCNICTT